MADTAAIQVIVTGTIVGLGTLIPQWLERKKRRERSSVLVRIEDKIDGNHRAISEQMQHLGLQLNEVDRTATEALHHCVGPDGRNGLRSRVDEIERWQESETLRQRVVLENKLAEARRHRGMAPNDVGKLNPGGAT